MIPTSPHLSIHSLSLTSLDPDRIEAPDAAARRRHPVAARRTSPSPTPADSPDAIAGPPPLRRDVPDLHLVPRCHSPTATVSARPPPLLLSPSRAPFGHRAPPAPARSAAPIITAPCHAVAASLSRAPHTPARAPTSAVATPDHAARDPWPRPRHLLPATAATPRLRQQPRWRPAAAPPGSSARPLPPPPRTPGGSTPPLVVPLPRGTGR
nr:WAS/WASL-interacting protein family member 2-like [Aegilops tauschii subsp. strangulata]